MDAEMKRYLILLLLMTPLMRSSSAPVQATSYIGLAAYPEQATIGGSVLYVAGIQSSNVITGTATLTITARLDNISLDTTPDSHCSARNNLTSVIVWCGITERATSITVRATLLGGSRKMVTIDGEFNGATAWDSQFVSGVRTYYLPMIRK